MASWDQETWGLRLGDGFIGLGHTVKIGTRNPSQDKLAAWVAKHGAKKASAGSFAEAASFGEMIGLATSWEGTHNALKLADRKNFSGKVVIDVTNPLDFSKGMPPRLAVGHTDSGGETVQRLLPDARVVKSFNIVGNPTWCTQTSLEGRQPCSYAETMRKLKRR